MPDVRDWMHLPLSERIYEPSWWLSGLIAVGGFWAAWQFVQTARRLQKRRQR